MLKFWCLSKHKTIIVFSLLDIWCLLISDRIWNAQLFLLCTYTCSNSAVFPNLDILCLQYFWVNPEYLIFWGPVIFSFQTPAKNLLFPKHDTIFFFQLIGHFVSTHLWVDSECPNFFLARCFFIIPIIYFFYYRWLENHQVDAGLLSENEYTIQRRKDVCAQMIELEKQGYYVVYLDES